MTSNDVVVAGAGAAGLVAALAAAAAGARVVLLERDAAAPNLLSVSGGLFSAAGTRWQQALGITDSPERFAADIDAKTAGSVPPVLRDTVARNAVRVADFFADVLGLPLHLHRGHWPGHSAERLHASPAESGAEFAQLFRAAVLREARIALHDSAELLALLPGVTGVEVSEAGSRRRIAAGAVVLATGGFSGNPELLAQYAPGAERAVHVGGRYADGRAVLLGAEAGGALDCMDAYQGQPHVSPHLIDGVRPRFGAALPSLGAVLVNRAGQRFAAEDMGPSELTAHLLAQPDGSAVEIWGEAAQAAAMAGGPFRRAVELGAPQRCESLAALAARFALPQAALAATLAEAARAASGEAADGLGRRRWGAPLVPPFYAAEVTGALAHTQGGLRVDAQAGVLRPDGTRVARLFAAGGAACGISGHGAAGYVPGNGLAQSFALGLLAGEAAAAAARGR